MSQKPVFCDVVQRHGTSQEEKNDNSQKHLQEFLGTSKKISDLVVEDITFDFAAQFGDYLASHAKKGRSKDKDLILQRGYFSAVVNFLKFKFHDTKNTPKELEDSHFSKVCTQISAIKFEQAS